LNKKEYYDIGNSTAEIYFAPKDDPVTRITQLINTSKQYVYMPTFLITHRKIADSLIAAKKRGVDVRVIIDANGANTSHSKHQLLRESGIILKTENYAGKLHAKSIIIDDEYIITGSMNFSYSGAEKNDENVLIINNKVLAKGFKDFFLYIWTKIPNKYLKQNVHPESKESIGSCSDGVDNNFNGLIDNEEKLCR
jgi:phosphatidylserine/phosphatidylglycerophosphate/cardiolipin synthase-like enzyme